MRSAVRLTLSVALLFCLATAAQAQPGGGRGFGGGFGGGFGTSRLRLLQVEAVQKELGLTEDQIASIKKLQGELAPMGRGRGGGGGGRPGGNGQRGRRPANPDVRVEGPERFFVQAQGQRTPPSEEDIKKFREQAQERAKKEREELAKILKPEQAKRLMEIYVQQAGVNALSDDEVAKAVGVSDEQKEKMGKIRQEAMAGMRDLFGGGDREAARAKLEDLQKSTNEKVLAVLSDDQKKKFEDLKGKKFDMPEQPRGGRPGGNRPQN
jgi:hypothetical protein